MRAATLYANRQIVRAVMLVLGIVAGVLHGDTATAATFYVAMAGNDGNPGTAAQPLRTIRTGVRMMRTGDTLYIRGGTYYESINSRELEIPIGTSWENAPRIAAYPAETVVLKGAYGNGINLAAPYIQYIIFDRLIVDGGGLSVQRGANHVRFQNGEIKNALGQGVQGGFGSTTTTHLQLINTKIYRNGKPQGATSGGRWDHGVYVAIQNSLIDGCEIFENTGYGIHMYDTTGGNSSNSIVRNSRVYNNRGDAGVILSYGSNIHFYNNIVNNNQNGVGVNYNATNVQIYNNTVYNHVQGTGIEVGASARNTVVRNNSIYNNVSTIVDYGAGTMISENVLNNPRYVTPAAPSFTLQRITPVRNGAASLRILLTNFARLPFLR
jgi:hypothetical protein